MNHKPILRFTSDYLTQRRFFYRKWSLAAKPKRQNLGVIGYIIGCYQGNRRYLDHRLSIRISDSDISTAFSLTNFHRTTLF